MLAFATNPACGIIGAFAGDISIPKEASPTASAVAAVPTILGQLVGLYQNNEYLFTELKSVNLKLTRAREYLATPGTNPVLARAHVERLRAKHSAVLLVLRANRVQVRSLLAGPTPPPCPPKSEAKVASFSTQV